MPILIVTVLATLGPAASRPTFAAIPPKAVAACAHDLANQEPTVLFPWPAVPPELIGAMRRHLGPPNPDDEHARTHWALTQGAPNAILRDLFWPLTLAEVRRHFGRDGDPVPPLHPARYDRTGARELIARSLPDVTDHALRDRWVQFLERDPDRAVRLRLRRVALAWTPAHERNARLAAALAEPVPDSLLLKAAIDMPHAFAAAVRWRLIQRLARRDADDEALVRAINTLPDADLPHAWYHDYLIVRNLRKALVRYDSRLRDVPRVASAPSSGPTTAHESAAYEYALDLNGLNATYVRNKQIEFLTHAFDSDDDRRLFAEAILSWSKLLRVVDDFARVARRRRITPADRAAALVGLRVAVGDHPDRWAVGLHRVDEVARAPRAHVLNPARHEYDERTLAAYQRTLEDFDARSTAEPEASLRE